MPTQSFRVPQPSTAPSIPILVGGEEIGGEELFDELKETYRSIARRAYELHEGRDCREGDGVADWLRAESELLIPVRAAIEDSGGQLIVRVLAQSPDDDEVLVHVEPQRIIVHSPGGRAGREIEEQSGSTDNHPNRLLHVIDLPVAVDPASARVMLDDGLLEVWLLKIPIS